MTVGWDEAVGPSDWPGVGVGPGGVGLVGPAPRFFRGDQVDRQDRRNGQGPQIRESRAVAGGEGEAGGGVEAGRVETSSEAREAGRGAGESQLGIGGGGLLTSIGRLRPGCERDEKSGIEQGEQVVSGREEVGSSGAEGPGGEAAGDVPDLAGGGDEEVGAVEGEGAEAVELGGGVPGETVGVETGPGGAEGDDLAGA